MAGQDDENRRTHAIRRAIERVTEALDILDAHGGPAEAAAHLDLALQKLREAIGKKS